MWDKRWFNLFVANFLQIIQDLTETLGKDFYVYIHRHCLIFFLCYTVTQMPVGHTRRRSFQIISLGTMFFFGDNVLHWTGIDHCFQTVFSIFTFTFHSDVTQYTKLSVQFSFFLLLAVSPSGFVRISVNVKGSCKIVIMMCLQQDIFFLTTLYCLCTSQFSILMFRYVIQIDFSGFAIAK